MSQVLLCLLTPLPSETAEEERKQPDTRFPTYTFCFKINCSWRVLQISRIYVPGTCSEISVDAGAICDLICKSEGLSVATCVCSFLASEEVWICNLNAQWQAES